MRFVGDPATRIAEDYLRILRFFRFFARYGAGPADPAALAAIRGGVPGMARLSVERVWAELSGLLAAPDPCASVRLMAELGVLAAVLPEGADPARLARFVAAGAPPDPLLRLAALLTGVAAALAARLRLSTAERDRLAVLRGRAVPRPGDDDAALRRMLAEETAATLLDRTWLVGDAGPEWRALRERIAALPRPVFSAGGSRRAGSRRGAGATGRRIAARRQAVVAGGRLRRRPGRLPCRTGTRQPLRQRRRMTEARLGRFPAGRDCSRLPAAFHCLG